MKLCGTVLPILVNEVTPDKPLSPGPRGRSGPNRVRPAEGHGAPLCGAGHRVIWREHFAQGLRGGLAWGLRAGTSGASCGTPLWDAVGLRVGRRPRPWISCCLNTINHRVLQRPLETAGLWLRPRARRPSSEQRSQSDTLPLCQAGCEPLRIREEYPIATTSSSSDPVSAAAASQIRPKMPLPGATFECAQAPPAARAPELSASSGGRR
jgi:hypothetical protein